MVLIVVLYKIDSLSKIIINKIRKTMGEVKQMSQKTKRILIPILASLVVAAGGIAITAQFPEITGTVAEAASVRVEDSDTSKEEDFEIDVIVNDDYEIESYSIISYKGTASNVVIPSTYNGKSVTVIESDAFRENTSIKKVIIPDSITTIGSESFLGCINLDDIIIPDSVEMIYGGAFSNCTSLKNVNIQGVFEIIGDSVFENTPWINEQRLRNPLVVVNNQIIDASSCTGKVIIPDGIETLNMSILFGCSNLDTVVIPSSVRNIDSGGSTIPCKAIMVEESNPYYCSIDGVLYNKDRTKLVSYPKNKPGSSYTIEKGTKIIGIWAFTDNKNLITVEFPKTLEKIDEYAFMNSEKLATLTIPQNIKEYGYHCFAGCFENKTIGPVGGGYDVEFESSSIIPDFDGCAMKSIVIPKGITNFNGLDCCSNLIKITMNGDALNLGSSEYPFAAAPDGLKIYVPKGATGYTKKPWSLYNIVYYGSSSESKLQINRTKATMYPLNTLQLKITGGNGKTIWKSSKSTVAKVNANGKVTALKSGKTTITATQNGKKVSCVITVKEPKLSSKKEFLTVGKTKKISLVGANQSVKWSSKNTKVAKISKNGTIKAIGQGKTTIIAKYNSNIYSCSVVVNAPINRQESLSAMAAYGIDCAFKDARYPSGLVLNSIKYEEGLVNGYGDKIDRMLLRFYGVNGLGGYSDLYVVVIKVPSKDNYDNVKKYKTMYMTTSSHNANPGMFGKYKVYDNEKAINSYHTVFKNNKKINYD